MPADAFDVIPYEDIKGNWKRLGSGSFGNVYKGNYLGIDVAIKEVLPSTDYDVAKYFEREWRLMKECRHPNICLFIGLSRAPDPDNRIFIISEFIENGNVRMYIHDKTKPFPWRLRLSFATDVTRALAYLHARKCIHRDLKGENLLVTANGRLKITDFGFARIAARNPEESKRLTFCGTDSYMSPEILVGNEFDLPTDIFSLGIIFCEIAARVLADDENFKRHPPHFEIEDEEITRLASPDCPPSFIQLCIDCLSIDPAGRPTTREILERLRLIEAEILIRPSEIGDTHVGSVRFMSGNKKAPGGPRIPSFGVDVEKNIKTNGTSSDDSDDDEFMEAVVGLSAIGINSHWSDGTGSISNEPLLNRNASSSSFSEYSTTVIRAHPQQGTFTQMPSLSSILTIKTPDPNPNPILPATPVSESTISTAPTQDHQSVLHVPEGALDPLGTSLMSIASNDSYKTAHSLSANSSTFATGGGSTIHSLRDNFPNIPSLIHRFTLFKPGAKPRRNSGSMSPSNSTGDLPGWSPLDLFFSSALLVAKCDVCHKRLGWKAILECDDCGMRAHVKCGEVAPRDCGTRIQSTTQSHQFPILSVSPLSKVKQNIVASNQGGSPKSGSPGKQR